MQAGGVAMVVWTALVLRVTVIGSLYMLYARRHRSQADQGRLFGNLVDSSTHSALRQCSRVSLQICDLRIRY